MTTNRRSFLASILVGCSAPAIVRASSLMNIVVPKQDIILPNNTFTVLVGRGLTTPILSIVEPNDDLVDLIYRTNARVANAAVVSLMEAHKSLDLYTNQREPRTLIARI